MIDLKHMKWARKRRGLTQGQVAYKLGLTNETICRYETGRLTPSILVLCKLSELYGIHLDSLIDWDAI